MSASSPKASAAGADRGRHARRQAHAAGRGPDHRTEAHSTAPTWQAGFTGDAAIRAEPSERLAQAASYTASDGGAAGDSATALPEKESAGKSATAAAGARTDGEPAASRLYAKVANDPLNPTDPTGAATPQGRADGGSSDIAPVNAVSPSGPPYDSLELLQAEIEKPGYTRTSLACR